MTGAVACPSCGASASGNFCSTCGASLTGKRKSSLEDMILIGEPIGLARAFWRIMRAPFSEPVRIAALSSDKSPYKFLIAGIGVFIGFFIAMEAIANSWGVQGFTPEQHRILNLAKYAIIIHLAVAAMLVYAAFALVSGRKVSFVVHARLWALLAGYYLVAEALMLIAAVLAYAVTYFAVPGFAQTALQIFNAVISPAVIVVLLIMFLNLIAAQARQWGKPVWISALIFAVCLLVTPLIAQSIQNVIGAGVGNAARSIGMQSLFGVPL